MNQETMTPNNKGQSKKTPTKSTSNELKSSIKVTFETIKNSDKDNVQKLEAFAASCEELLRAQPKHKKSSCKNIILEKLYELNKNQAYPTMNTSPQKGKRVSKNQALKKRNDAKTLAEELLNQYIGIDFFQLELKNDDEESAKTDHLVSSKTTPTIVENSNTGALEVNDQVEEHQKDDESTKRNLNRSFNEIDAKSELDNSSVSSIKSNENLNSAKIGGSAINETTSPSTISEEYTSTFLSTQISNSLNYKSFCDDVSFKIGLVMLATSAVLVASSYGAFPMMTALIITGATNFVSNNILQYYNTKKLKSITEKTPRYIKGLIISNLIILAGSAIAITALLYASHPLLPVIAAGLMVTTLYMAFEYTKLKGQTSIAEDQIKPSSSNDDPVNSENLGKGNNLYTKVVSLFSNLNANQQDFSDTSLTLEEKDNSYSI